MADATEQAELPPSDLAHLISRVHVLPVAPEAREWTGNGARGAHDHHELVSLNVVPFYLRLLWTSADRTETVEVGKFKMNLRGLSSAGFVQLKGRQVRLRFVRKDTGLVVVQANDQSAALSVGRAEFRR
jgi:hypothetical protein